MTFRTTTSLLVMAVLASAVGFAQTQITSCGTISAAGNYQIANDISSTTGTCLVISNISSGQVYIDGQGHSVTSSASHDATVSNITSTTLPAVKFYNTAFRQPASGGYNTVLGSQISSIEFDYCSFWTGVAAFVDDSTVQGKIYFFGALFENAGVTTQGFGINYVGDLVVGTTHFHNIFENYPQSALPGVGFAAYADNSANANMIFTVDSATCNGGSDGTTGHGIDDCFFSTAYTSDTSKAPVFTVKNTTCGYTYDMCAEFEGPAQVDFENNTITNATIGIGCGYHCQMVNSTVANNSTNKCNVWYISRSSSSDLLGATVNAPVFEGNSFSSNTSTGCSASNYPGVITFNWSGMITGGIYSNSFTSNDFDYSVTGVYAPYFYPVGNNAFGNAMWTDGGSNKCGSPSSGQSSPYPLNCPHS